MYQLTKLDPFVSHQELHDRPIGIPSQVVAILWMGMSAFTDGVLTLLLVIRFIRTRSSTTSLRSGTIVTRLVSLTLETVLLTHIVGASMCIIFLASPPARRTSHPLFWVLLEIITELYALSILFTINARNPAKDELDGMDAGGRQGQSQEATIALGQTELDRRVEGYQGSTPFGIRVAMPTLGYHSSLGYQDGTTSQQWTSEPNSANLETPYHQGVEDAWSDGDQNGVSYPLESPKNEKDLKAGEPESDIKTTR